MKIQDFLLIHGLRKNILSISSLEEKGFKISFADREFLMWTKGKSFNDEIVIGFQEGGLYKLKGHSETTLVHNIVNPCELWNKILAHLHYKALPIMSNIVTGLHDI
jgi:hypothetical protein